VPIRAVLLAGLVLLGSLPGTALAVATRRHAAHPIASERHPTASSPLSQSPSSPPLSAGAEVQEEGLSPAGEADPLVSNGLGSPSCKRALGEELSAASRRNCQTSGFIAAAAPTGNYGIDVHIDTGVLGLSSGGLLSIVQDLVITPLWMALVWSAHALIVMLEWSFTIDLLDSATAGGLGSSLRTAQTALTMPWLSLGLACASILIAYDGLVRRRVAETLGEALMMGVMIAGGLWLIVDPSGTVGALGRWANQASLGTLAVAAGGTPGAPGQTLSRSMDTLFAQAIESPWCYLEFGQVAWCRNPADLDPRLRAAALKIAASESSSKQLEHSVELLHDADDNGAIFLSLPANGAARNSINEPGSLLHTLCQSSEATNCRGPTAAQAEFRTNGGTWSRLGGLLLIVVGLLGMLLLLGFLAVRLLGAALFSILYLLLAPGIVIAPAFGHGGRMLFRRWISRLLGAVVSKLVFSFLLGVVLAVLAILSDLQALGWWTQWLLMSAFWWSAFARRHQAIGVLGSVVAAQRSTSEHVVRRSVARRMSGAIESRKGMAAARWASSKLSRPTPDAESRRSSGAASARPGAAKPAVSLSAEDQVTRALESEHRAAGLVAGAGHESEGRLSAKGAQLVRLRRERAAALAAENPRRAAEMGHRADRVAGEIDREREVVGRARRVLREGEHALRSTGSVHTREQVAERARFFDAQAQLPARSRDHAALAGLAGYGREEYEHLDPRRARAVRVEIDRELALRRGLTGGLKGAARPRAESAGSSASHATAGAHPPAGKGERGPLSASRRRGGPGSRRDAGSRPVTDRSGVLSDAREVAARRKRQLGRERP
jgi:hypothetical protein